VNVLLIYPEFPDTFWSFKHALKFIRKRASFPPLGLLTVAAMLPDDWNLRLVDLNIAGLTSRDLAWADMAFVGGMAIQGSSAERALAACEEAGVRIVAGGPLFTLEQERFPQVDHFVLNEAEVTLPRFLADLDRGQAQHLYSSTEFPDLGLTPVPRWDLVDVKSYASMSIQYSRGCPFDCDFCNVTSLLGHRPRTKSAEQIIAELDSLWNHGWRRPVFFVDDNLIGHRRKLKTELLPALIDWQESGRRIPFLTEASINLADDDKLMEMMGRAGFDCVFVGIETPSDESLAECSKSQNTNRDLVADVRKIHRAGIQVQAGFIVGFDNDTPSIFQRQIDFIQQSGIVTAMVGMLQAPPGTRLYERLMKEGRLLGHSTGDNVDGTTNIIPKMSMETLREGYREILEHIYSPKHYYKRVRTFLREYKTPRVKTPLSLRDVMAFIRSTYRLGIFGKERFRYWQLMVWTLFCRPQHFSLAITLAIYGHHFRKVCELHVV
jgi:radical SAM superfamily enzyme YgiQ (UPF0313 family)